MFRFIYATRQFEGESELLVDHPSRVSHFHTADVIGIEIEFNSVLVKEWLESRRK